MDSPSSSSPGGWPRPTAALRLGPQGSGWGPCPQCKPQRSHLLRSCLENLINSPAFNLNATWLSLGHFCSNCQSVPTEAGPPAVSLPDPSCRGPALALPVLAWHLAPIPQHLGQARNGGLGVGSPLPRSPQRSILRDLAVASPGTVTTLPWASPSEARLEGGLPAEGPGKTWGSVSPPRPEDWGQARL